MFQEGLDETSPIHALLHGGRIAKEGKSTAGSSREQMPHAKSGEWWLSLVLIEINLPDVCLPVGSAHNMDFCVRRPTCTCNSPVVKSDDKKAFRKLRPIVKPLKPYVLEIANEFCCPH